MPIKPHISFHKIAKKKHKWSVTFLELYKYKTANCSKMRKFGFYNFRKLLKYAYLVTIESNIFIIQPMMGILSNRKGGLWTRVDFKAF